MMNDMVDMLMTAAINVAIESLPDVIDDVRELFKLNDSLNNDFDDSIYDKADEQNNIKIFENIMKKIIIDMNVVNKFADKLIRAGCPTKYEAYRIIADDKYFIQCTELIQSVINNSSIDTFGINIPKLINSFEKESKFIFLDKKCLLLGEHVNKIFLNYNKKIIRIIYYNFNVYSLYYLINLWYLLAKL